MPKTKLTDKTVSSLKTEAGGRQTEWWDSDFSGASFGVRVGYHQKTEKFTRTFILRYRNERGELRRLTLGSYPILSLAEARAKARSIIGRVEEGEDPAAKKAEFDAAATFGELCEQFLLRHVSQKKPATQYEYKRMIKKYLLPAWQNWKIEEVKKRDALALIDKIADRSPGMALHVRAAISKIFNFAMRKDLAQFNPVHQTDLPAKINARTRVLSADEIKSFWAACDKLEDDMGSLLKLILLTGQRPGEVKSMRWRDIEDDNWVIPPEIAKNGRRHVVPLAPFVLQMLNQLRAKGEEHRTKTDHPGFQESIPLYVFYSDTGRHVQWLTKALVRINEFCDFEERFTAHDLRRSCATGMASIGTSREIIAAVLNHKTADNVVTARYDLYDRFPEKRKALLRWAKHVEGLVSDKRQQAKVVSLGSGRKQR